VHRALVGDFENPLALVGIERSFQADCDLDLVQQALFAFALGAEADKNRRRNRLHELKLPEGGLEQCALLCLTGSKSQPVQLKQESCLLELARFSITMRVGSFLALGWLV
jgi:hypothetical protein